VIDKVARGGGAAVGPSMHRERTGRRRFATTPRRSICDGSAIWNLMTSELRRMCSTSPEGCLAISGSSN
jgi:hypothetical protein